MTALTDASRRASRPVDAEKVWVRGGGLVLSLEVLFRIGRRVSFEVLFRKRGTFNSEIELLYN